jgi:hypothetical protein
MSPRRIEVFFYGLFMDADLLRTKGAEPIKIRPACAPGFALRIGERATLLRNPDARAYGMLMELTHDEIDRVSYEGQHDVRVALNVRLLTAYSERDSTRQLRHGCHASQERASTRPGSYCLCREPSGKSGQIRIVDVLPTTRSRPTAVGNV